MQGHSQNQAHLFGPAGMNETNSILADGKYNMLRQRGQLQREGMDAWRLRSSEGSFMRHTKGNFNSKSVSHAMNRRRN